MIHDIASYGAVANGTTDNSSAIADAIAACAAGGGGTVRVPVGTWLTGPVTLCSNLTLELEAGAVLRFSDDFTAYPPTFTRWEGVECHGYRPLIYGRDLDNVAIVGPGTLDGQGQAWWDEKRRRSREKLISPVTEQDKALAELNPGYETAGGGGGGRESQFLRPPLIQLFECRHVQLRGFTARNSPFWNTHLVYCRDTWVSGVRFENPAGAPNTDGLDVDSCNGVRISDCTFDVGDDCVVIKSGCDADGRRVGRPCENLVISNCTMLHGHGGVVLGSEGAAGIKNVTVTNCVFHGTDRGIRLKSRRGRGGITENIICSNIIMEQVHCPFVFNLFYRCGHDPATAATTFAQDAQPVDETTPGIRNLTITNVVSRQTKAAAGVFLGLAEAPIDGLTLADITIDMTPGPKPSNPAMAYGIKPMRGKGIWGRDIRNATFRNVRIRGSIGPAIDLESVAFMTLDAVVAQELEGAESAIQLIDAESISHTGCRTDDSVAELVRGLP